MERDIKQSVNELGSLLSKVKGSGHMSLNQPSQKTDTAQHAVMIVTPLMDFIDKLFSQLAQVSRRRRLPLSIPKLPRRISMKFDYKHLRIKILACNMFERTRTCTVCDVYTIDVLPSVSVWQRTCTRADVMTCALTCAAR